MKASKYCESVMKRNDLGPEHAKVVSLVCMCEMRNGAAKLEGSVLKIRYQVSKASGPKFSINKDVFEDVPLSSPDVVTALVEKGFLKTRLLSFTQLANTDVVEATMAGYDSV